MLHSKIALKLSMDFAAALLIFSVVIGGVFLVLFKNYTVDVHKAELQNYAESLAESLSGERTRGFGNGLIGYGSYLRLIGELTGADVWIADENLNLITTNVGQRMMNRGYKLTDLPPNASELIREVFTDKAVFSEGFSDVLSQLTLTVGVPIKNASGVVWGVVLLHSPVDGTTQAVHQGLVILSVSIVLALIIAFAMSLAFSYSFTKPLAKMKVAALRLSHGDYTAACNIKQNDEIGELSSVLDLLAIRLEEASQQSARLEQMRRDFVANISHELRTPITVIRGSLEALCEKVITDPKKVEDYHWQMLSEAKFLQRLVGDLLDLSRLQNTDFVIEKQAVSVCDVLSDVSRSAGQLAQNKNVKIAIELQSPCLQIHGDYGRLRQMFLIILDNAIKFSPADGKVDISISEHQISIRDYGTGIDSEHLPYIFDRFYKTQGEQNKSGTGLGLAIAKQIADRHQIVLSARNHSESGAEFVFELP